MGAFPSQLQKDQIVNVGVAYILLQPPTMSNLILNKLVQDNWDRILDLLDYSSVLSLMLTCKDLHGIVSSYIDHHISGYNHLEMLKKLFEEPNSMPLIINESPLKNYFNNQSNNYKPNLILLRGVRNYLHQGRYLIQREKVIDSDSFAHRENRRYFQKIYDQQLNRDVVLLKTVCWLDFSKHFNNIQPGKYKFSLRLKLTPDLHWGWQPNHFCTTIQVLSNRTSRDIPEEKLVSTTVKSSEWKKLSQGIIPSLENAQIKLENSYLDWMWIVLDSFEISKCCSLTFHFRDVDNPIWKSGMIWDIIQLRLINNKDYF